MVVRTELAIQRLTTKLHQPTRHLSTRAKKITDFNSKDYQFLQQSVIPSYHFQKSLRRLPIPKLEDSIRRYLNAVKAVFANEAEYKDAEDAAKDFLGGDGPKLQKELVAFDNQNKHTSFISEPWFDMYLRSRLPVPINYNPFMTFASDPDPAYNEQLTRATNFVLACGRFKKSLDAENLEPEVFHMNPAKSDTKMFRNVCRMLPSNVSWFGAVAFKAFPLDMSQYSSLFGGNRIPKIGKDKLHLNRDARHFLVMRNGKFFTVELFDVDKKLLPPSVIHASLAKILESSKEPANPPDCVGALTTLDRDSWANVREELLQAGQKNLSTLQSIDDALFLLCLDDLKSEDPYRLVESLLYGDSGSNRWFDKCFQLIMDGNGQATINFEHSWGDGVCVLRLMEETMKDSVAYRFVEVGQQPDSRVPTDKLVHKLEWTLTESLKQKIQNAQQEHLKRAKELQFGFVQYDKLGRDVIKKYKVSPDSVMQLAFQHAFYKVYKEFVPTYESASTAAFLKGRTECVRSATSATREAVLALESGKDIKELFRKCSDAHSQLVKEAAMGQGFDRHLLGLKITAERIKMQVPHFFNHPSYQRMGHFGLSTSSLTSDTIVFGGFGPVVNDGFGIGYSVAPSKLGAVVSSYKEKRDSRQFCTQLESTLDQLRSALEGK